MAFAVREHRTRLFNGLEKVRIELRCAFAAACGERLLPYFLKVHKSTGRGDPKLIAAALETVWTAPRGGNIDQLGLRRMIEQSKANIFEDSCTDEWAFAADHCAAAITYGLMALASGKAQDAGWAGMRVLDAIDAYLQRLLFPKGGILRKEDNQRIWTDMSFQAEVSRQLADLADLQQSDDRTRADTVGRIRRRAQENSSNVFKS